MPKVNSTAIESVARVPGKTLVSFHTGDKYAVKSPRSVYRKLRKSRSVGVTYNREVRNKYPVSKV